MPRQQFFQPQPLPTQLDDQQGDTLRLASDGTVNRLAADLYPRWLGSTRAAKYCDVTPEVLREWVLRGLPASRIGERGRFRFDRLRLDAWLESQSVRVAHVPHVTHRVA